MEWGTYNLERISFGKAFWAVMKHKLDMFFFDYYLPLFVKWKTLHFVPQMWV